VSWNTCLSAPLRYIPRLGLFLGLVLCPTMILYPVSQGGMAQTLPATEDADGDGILSAQDCAPLAG